MCLANTRKKGVEGVDVESVVEVLVQTAKNDENKWVRLNSVIALGELEFVNEDVINALTHVARSDQV